MKNPVREVIDCYVNQEHTEEVDVMFRAWLTGTEHHEEKNRELHRLWDSTAAGATTRFEDSLQRMHSLTGISARRELYRLRKRMMIWRIAAVVAVMIATAGILLVRQPHDISTPDFIQAYVPKAEIQTVTLPDGTVVLINANSTIIYPEEFSGSTRSVYLSGEACFKVKADPSKPFVVKSGDLQVTALGTEFNVVAYPEEDQIITTLIEGKVKIEYDSLCHRAILMPHRQLIYNRTSHTAETVDADVNDVTAWQRGETVMRSLTADQIFTRLERKYPYTFIYSHRSLKSDRYTLTFKADTSLPEVMDVITKVMGDINYHIEADRCYIKPAN